MTKLSSRLSPRGRAIPKTSSGNPGIDEITGGGLPAGRPTLVCGSAGSGKTLFAMEFLVRGALEHGEPGVFIAFEESETDLADNVRSLGFDLVDLSERGLVRVDHVRIQRDEIEETGDYNLDGLFLRLAEAIDSIGAKRVVLDTIEVLFAGLSNHAVVRSELTRLFRWLKDRGITALTTAERGDGTLTRHGLEEYVSDCVISLEHRVVNGIATRRIRVLKYRGTAHGTDEHPFLIDESGLQVLPITSIGLEHPASTEQVSTGIPELDQMLGGLGVLRASSVLVSGTAGTGKSSLAAHFADAACRRGEETAYFAFEESPDQIVRNMRSIGLDLARWRDRGLLQLDSSRPTCRGLESHLVTMQRMLLADPPRVVIVDPITSFSSVGSMADIHSMLTRLVDLLKTKGITAVFTSLSAGSERPRGTDAVISSLMDTCLVLRNTETDEQYTRTIHVLKSRGMGHSSRVRRFALTDRGVELLPLAESGVSRVPSHERPRRRAVPASS